MFGTVQFDDNQSFLLSQKLGPEYISDRQGPGGKKVQ
jgi:recombination DNA repair RAD52 pathway protein